MFISSFNFALKSLTTENDLRELMDVLRNYFDCRDREKEQQIIQNLIDQRKNKDPAALVDPDDALLKVLREMITISPA